MPGFKKFLGPLLSFLLLILIAAPLFTVHAAAVDLNNLTKDDVPTILNNILTVIYNVFFILAAIFIIFAAFSFLTAAGDEEKIRTAKSRLLYAIIAIVIALFSLTAGAIVSGVLRNPTG